MNARSLAGFALLLLSLSGLAYSVRTAVSYAEYRSAQYGHASENPQAVLALCREAAALYPFNYRLCELAAMTAFYGADALPPAEARRMRDASKAWCGRGLVLDRYQRRLRWLAAQFLLEDSPARAAAYWKEYVDWDFWFPFNHGFLAELYAKAGDFTNAEKALSWAAGSEFEAHARATIDAERASRAGAPATAP